MPQERILVVEDEEAVRSVVTALLEHCGYETTAVQGAEEALTRL
jgi:CheY-like chemotaxis protein